MLVLAGLPITGAQSADTVRAIPSRHVVVDPMSGLAIQGYDPVAYFVDGRARQGLPEHELRWSGVIWRFANEGNLAAFKADPLIYAPAYGGYDARTFSAAVTAPGNPQVWAIRDQRLFLFYSPARRFSWLVAPQTFIADADAAWQALLK